MHLSAVPLELELEVGMSCPGWCSELTLDPLEE